MTSKFAFTEIRKRTANRGRHRALPGALPGALFAGFTLALIAAPAALAQTAPADSAPSQSQGDGERPENRSLRLSLATGVDVSGGDFGDENGVVTTTIAVPTSLRLNWGDFRFSVTVPWLSIEGPGGVVADGVIIDPDAVGTVETNSGLGDVTLGVNYSVPSALTGNWFVEFQSRVKIPTSDIEDGRSTGEVDVGFTGDVGYSFGKFSPFVSVGYRFRGDPEGTDLNNTVSTSVGASYLIGSGVSVLATYDYQQRTVDSAEASQEIFGAFSGPVGKKVRWTLYGSVGLSDGAPGGGAGFQLTLRQ